MNTETDRMRVGRQSVVRYPTDGINDRIPFG